MRDFAKKNGALILALLGILAVCLLFAWRKNGLFIDEIYTYGLSNSHCAPFLADTKGGELEGAVFTRQDLMDYVTVDKSELGDLGSVYYNQVHDVHPPLYYWLFHLASCLTPGVFSKWTGLGLDLVLYLLTLLALYRLTLYLFGSRENAVAAVILYGLCGLGLSTMLMIRMYALLTLFTVLLALWIARLMREDRLIWLILTGLTVFLGLLTQYYFVFYAFFVCAAFVFWCAGKRRWKTLLRFVLFAFGGVGAMLLVFPSCIRHMTAEKVVSGGSVVERLLSFRRYGEWISFFSREVHPRRTLQDWVALALLVLLLLFGRKLLAAAKAGKLPWDSLVVLLPAFVCYVPVAVLSPQVEQRYIYNLVPLYAAFACFLIALLERSLGTFPRERLWKSGALLLLLGLSVLAVRSDPPRYIYPVFPYYEDTYAAYDAAAAEHAGEPCLYLTEYSYPITQDLGQLLTFDDFLVTADPESPALQKYLAGRSSPACVVYIDISETWSSGFKPEEMLPRLIAATDYTRWEELYQNGLSSTYVLRK